MPDPWGVLMQLAYHVEVHPVVDLALLDEAWKHRYVMWALL